MEQMQAFIEKAKNDKELMAKLDALGASGAGPDKMPGEIVALAAEYGFSITEEDYRKANEQAGAQKTGELKEEELEAAAGGGRPTGNYYDPKTCDNVKTRQSFCQGFLLLIPCDHYVMIDGFYDTHYKCNMGCFDYKEPKPEYRVSV